MDKSIGRIILIIRQDLALFLTPFITLLLLTLLFFFLLPDSSIYMILTGAILCVFTSVVLGFIARFNLSYSSSTWLIVLVNFFFIPIIGIILMGFGFLLVSSVPQGKWNTLPSPPEKAVRFLPSSAALGSVRISIQSETGKEFLFSCNSFQNNCQWGEILDESFASVEKEVSTCGPDLVNGFNQAPPLFKQEMIDTYQECYRFPELIAYMKAVILENGKIKLWTYNSGGWAFLFSIIVFAIIGLVAGIATSIATNVISVRRNKVHASGALSPEFERIIKRL